MSSLSTACSAVPDRSAYARVVKHSAHVDPQASNQGVARALLHALIESTEQAGI
jgi:phosphinothricin acetyltransferase